MATTVNLPLITLEANQYNPETVINNNLEVLDCLVHLAVESDSLTSPPTAGNGESYIVAAGATGAWSGKSGNIAYYYNGWKFIVPNIGFWAYIKSSSQHKVWTGVVWTLPTIGTEFTDSTFRILNASAPTGKVSIDAGNVTAGTVVNIEAPNSDHVLNKQKLNGTTNPTSSDDSGDGYSVGSIWIDTTNDIAYICVDSTVGSAVWKQISN
jgi:hypothetical protein